MYSTFSIIRIWIYTFTSSFAILYAPILLLFYESKGVNIAQIGILFAISSVVNIITEVPFGMFSDNYSKKLSAVLGVCFTIIGLLIYINGEGLIEMAIAVGILAVGLSGKSGAVEAILVRTVKNQDTFFHISNYTTYLANAISGIMVGFIFKVNELYPFYISIGCEIILLILVLSVKENVKESKEFSKTSNKMSLKKVILFINNYKFMFLVLFVSYFFIPQISVYFPEYLDVQKLPVESFGIIYFVMNLIPMVGTYIYKKRLAKMKTEKLVLTSLILLSIYMFIMGLFKNVIIGLTVYALSRIIIGWFWMVFSIYFNTISNDSNKATVFSVKGMVMNIAFILSDPFFGYVIFKNGIFYSYLITSLFVFISGVLLFLRHNSVLQKGRKHIYIEK
ncbi:MFS transporter [Fervidibacillus halotolerans]|uniref:MFS transporter n=1 Tax=Fervidibacillus halotolerans TaxID=2980027 RepID=A0A9E8LZ45_9BACI|nr:MFS transporter [Fervidibacillus halotolerans]WAA12458.1 MFS transporter [Fervidibacillus halotolerans]